MASADSAPPAAFAALARAARSLRDAPAPEQGWRLRQLIGDAARLAAIGGADPLSLAQEAWQAATDASGGARDDAAATPRSPDPDPPDALAERRRTRTEDTSPAAAPAGPRARVLPFRRRPR
jgi:hypothetical protein